ncbi:MAG: hypothetical protein NXI10_08765 [bacterium]|nr:hypothetical protein [bacterium]
MKLPVPGFVSQALSSLINNNRRVKRTPFDKLDGSRPNEGLKYKEVSDEERKQIVAEIIQKRRRRFLVGALIVWGTLMILLLLFVLL